ncbi:hypothetical protein V2J09_005651 [Rumex salicifolius]
MAGKKEQKNSLDHKSQVNNEKHQAPECRSHLVNGTGKRNDIKDVQNGDDQHSVLTEEVKITSSAGDGRRRNKKSSKSQRRAEQGMDAKQSIQKPAVDKDKSGIDMETAHLRENGTSESSKHAAELLSESPNIAQDRLQTEDISGYLQLSDILGFDNLKTSILSLLETCYQWMEKQKPLFIAVTSRTQSTCAYIHMKYVQAYPVALRWLQYFGSISFLVLMIWLTCFLRGVDSFVRIGTTSFFSVIWFSILSVIAMVGMFKFLLVLAAAAIIGVFVGFIIALLTCAVSGAVILWIYGSFWTTSFVIALGGDSTEHKLVQIRFITFLLLIIYCAWAYGGVAGLAFVLRHERLALLITTIYSVYCAWAYVGWLGLLLGFNLSFLSSDILFFFKSNMDGTASAEQADGMHSQQSFFNGEPGFSDNCQGKTAERSAGVTSTSGSDSEITSEDEVVRLLNCTDHYSALGLSKFELIDVSVLKREYKKKAMLVHPDKNMGNEKAAEAFKKLQNAYEVLLDSLKRKAYDDELRREELLNYLRRFQSIPQKKGRNGFFPNGFANSEADNEDPLGEARRIACKKCGDFHVWFHTKKSKSRARWCQDCKDFHQAKDGDGWVEQSSQPLLFGILQKVDAPVAYVCADSKVYNATEWYICQGMRCPANSHKPSFHVNTNVTKNSQGRGSTSQRGGIPGSNMEEQMTEEEFFEWIQNAVNSGMFENFDGSPTDPFKKNAAGANTSGSSNSKRKKKGKKQW